MKKPVHPSLVPIGIALVLGIVMIALLIAVPPAAAAAEGTAKIAAGGDAGWVFIGAALATGVAALGAGLAVARVGTAAVGALAEKPELFGRLLIFIGLAEGIAIYGLIIAILMLNRLG